MKIKFGNILLVSAVGLSSFSYLTHAKSGSDFLYLDPPPDSTSSPISAADCTKTTTPEITEENLYNDRHGDPINNPSPNSPFVIEPSNIKSEVVLLPDLSGYEIKESLGDELEYRPPSKMTPQDLAEYRRKELMRAHFRELSKTNKEKERENGEDPLPKLPPKKAPLVNIVPTGNVTISLGGRWQRTRNPAVPVRLQRTGGFDFDQQIQLNLLGSIGDRLKVTANWNTKAQFDFDNNLKIAYTAKEEDWLRDIQAGTISVPLNTQLIRGAQKLMGVKTVMQFGKVGVTAFAASQRGATETLIIKGGGQGREFEFPISEYDTYRHFFLGQYFRDIFEQAYLTNPTNPHNGLKINRVKVYITNSNQRTENLRNIVALTDLGEARDKNIQNTNIVDPSIGIDTNLVNNMFTDVNTLSVLLEDSTFRDPDNTSDYFTSKGLEPGVDFEKLNSARELEVDRDFTFHEDLGFISLNSRLQDDEALAVSFEYTLNGQSYTVGELNEDFSALDLNSAIVLKLLKPSRVDLDLNTWNLMMKNIYSLNTSRIESENFQLRVIYKDDATGIDNPSLQEGIKARNQPLLQLLGLDKMNPNGDLIPDGNFDFIDNATILTQKGQLIFPTPEPFGDYLNRPDKDAAGNTIGFGNKVFDDTEGALKNKYVFESLYDNTQGQARRETEFNKFFIKGNYQSATSSVITLSGLNIDENSVSVKSGTIPLNSGTDYTFSNGRVTILNESVLASGKDLIIQYEKADLFNFRQKTLMGGRIEYNHSKDFNFGTTIMRSAEAPVITRVSVGDEPVNNTQLGVDFSYQKDSRLLTKIIDRLPIIQTKEISTITTSWEAAAILPGNSKTLGETGTSYIDDFESAEQESDFSTSIQNWLISTPPVQLGNDPNTFEDYNKTDIGIGDHRGKLVWFNPDLTFYTNTIGTSGVGDTEIHAENNYTRGIIEQEVFVNKDITSGFTTPTSTFDLHYYPRERGPYNYNVNQSDIDASTGYFTSPENNWAGITRSITTDTDFENQNVEFIEFWMMDPFSLTDLQGIFPEELAGVSESDLGGDLFFNLGDISEDIIKDRKHGFENGLTDNVETTEFGVVTNETFISNAFDANIDRDLQDLGFDGINDNSERSSEFFGSYIADLQSFVNSDAPGLRAFENDPSSDNFAYYISDDDDSRLIPERYKNFNGYENNSPTESTESSGTIPNNEDLNNNKTLDEVDRYYQYHLPLNRDVFNGTDDHPFIVAVQPGDGIDFYQVRIPIKGASTRINEITNFNTIKYFRMYMAGFKYPVALRMLNFSLISSQWRKYIGNDLLDKSLGSDTREDIETYPNVYISTVSVEENANYQLPPGVVRDFDQTSITQARQDEKSLQICATDIKNGDGAAAFKNIAVDLINYKRIKMYIHGESNDLSTQTGDLYAYVRLGTDITENYYEIAVPLEMSGNGDNLSAEELWPVSNEIDIAIQDLTDTKLARNAAGWDSRQKFPRQVGKYRISVVGSPDRSTIRTVMLGIENPISSGDFKTTCVWFNELRVTDFDKQAGWATVGNARLKLADLGEISGALQYTSANYGDIESKIAERTRDKSLSYGAQTKLNMHKFGPEKIGLQLPLFISIDGEKVTPKFDPFDQDVLLSESIKNKTPDEQEEYRDIVSYNKTIKSINLSGIKKVKMKKDAKKHFFDIENISIDLSYKEESRKGAEQNSTYGNAIASYLDQNYRGAARYNYSFKPVSFAPFKKAKVKSKYFTLIKDFNLSLLPSSLSLGGTLNRRYFKNQLYNSDFRAGLPASIDGVDPTYEKSFTFDRNYALRWNLTKALNLSYTATANSLIDEPEGDRFGADGVRTQGQYSAIVWDNIKDLGRLKQLNQNVNLSYKIPINKIPAFNWITADAKYKINYSWTASAFESVQDEIDPSIYKITPQTDGIIGSDGQAAETGNLLQNGRDITLNTKLNLTRFYSKSKYLKSTLAPTRKPTRRPVPKAPLKEGEEEEEEEKKKIAFKNSKFVKKSVSSLLLVKNVTLKYDLQQTTDLPGILSTPQVLGANYKDYDGFAPGYEFLTGSQNLTLIRNQATNNGYYTRSTVNNTPLQQTTKETISGKATLEPLKGFRIQLDAKYTKTTGYQEIVRYNEDTDEFDILSPSFGGGIKSTFISLPSAFNRDDKSNNNAYFERFEDSRTHFKDKLNQENSSGKGSYQNNDVDVLIPAFLAAYSGKKINSSEDVSSKSLSKDRRIPLPNWRINYAGLGRIPALKKKFSSISLSHSYKSESEIRSFKTTTTYDEFDYKVGLDTREENLEVDENGTYIPLIAVNEIVITERFSPLIGINMRTKKGVSFKFNYNKSRNLSLDLSNTQLTEVRNNDFVIGFGFATKRLPGWMKVFNKMENFKPLKNDITFKMDMTIRDQITIQRQLTANDGTVGSQTVTAGNLNFQLRPTLSYQYNKKINLQLYFERTINNPKISTSFYRATTAFGLRLRFSLA